MIKPDKHTLKGMNKLYVLTSEREERQKRQRIIRILALLFWRGAALGVAVWVYFYYF